MKNWEKYCQSQITDTEEVPLTRELHEYVDSLNFGIFEVLPPLRIIDGHAKTRWYATRFGGGLRERPPAEPPPTDPTADEAFFERRNTSDSRFNRLLIWNTSGCLEDTW